MSLVPRQNVSILFGIVVALAMEHNALTRRKQSVAVFSVSATYTRKRMVDDVPSNAQIKIGVLCRLSVALEGVGGDILCRRCHPAKACINVLLNGRRWREG